MSLFDAIDDEDFVELKRLVENNGNKIDLNKEGLEDSEDSLLAAACYTNSLKIVKYLVDNGADINFKDDFGKSCFMIACSEGKLNIAQFLLSRGANINDKDSMGNSSLDRKSVV